MYWQKLIVRLLASSPSHTASRPPPPPLPFLVQGMTVWLILLLLHSPTEVARVCVSDFRTSCQAEKTKSYAPNRDNIFSLLMRLSLQFTQVIPSLLHTDTHTHKHAASCWACASLSFWLVACLDTTKDEPRRSSTQVIQKPPPPKTLPLTLLPQRHTTHTATHVLLRPNA